MAIFLAQFVTVYLLGVQSLNVRDGNNKGSQLLIWRPGISGNGSPATRYEPLAELQKRGDVIWPIL